MDSDAQQRARAQLIFDELISMGFDPVTSNAAIKHTMASSIEHAGRHRTAQRSCLHYFFSSPKNARRVCAFAVEWITASSAAAAGGASDDEEYDEDLDDDRFDLDDGADDDDDDEMWFWQREDLVVWAEPRMQAALDGWYGLARSDLIRANAIAQPDADFDVLAVRELFEHLITLVTAVLAPLLGGAETGFEGDADDWTRQSTCRVAE